MAFQIQTRVSESEDPLRWFPSKFHDGTTSLRFPSFDDATDADADVCVEYEVASPADEGISVDDIDDNADVADDMSIHVAAATVTNPPYPPADTPPSTVNESTPKVGIEKSDLESATNRPSPLIPPDPAPSPATAIGVKHPGAEEAYDDDATTDGDDEDDIEDDAADDTPTKDVLFPDHELGNPSFGERRA
jgi:hypothetical protein